MPTIVRSFAKINIGLCIGPLRPDGFHELRTVYQTVGIHDRVHVEARIKPGVEVHCKTEGVPEDESNTCHRAAQEVLAALGSRAGVTIRIEKNLPVQGGLGGASSNAVASMLGLERELKAELPMEVKMSIAARIGSDLPLFLIGGTVLGVAHGQEVYPTPELPSTACVLALPKTRISTPQAFASWELLHATKLTASAASDRINAFSCAVFLWLNGFISRQRAKESAERSLSGVPALEGGGRAETLLLDLVRTGIANDFEQVVFPEHPDLRDVKRVLQDEGAEYASLSGSGSAVYGLFASRAEAEGAASKLLSRGVTAQVTQTVNREEYWKDLVVSSS